MSDTGSTPIDTPSSLRSGPPSGSHSRRSVAGELVAHISSTAISLFCASKVAPLLLESTPGPLGVPRWGWALGALVLIAVPTSLRQATKLVQVVRGEPSRND